MNSSHIASAARVLLISFVFWAFVHASATVEIPGT